MTSPRVTLARLEARFAAVEAEPADTPAPMDKLRSVAAEIARRIQRLRDEVAPALAEDALLAWTDGLRDELTEYAAEVVTVNLTSRWVADLHEELKAYDRRNGDRRSELPVEGRDRRVDDGARALLEDLRAAGVRPCGPHCSCRGTRREDEQWR